MRWKTRLIEIAENLHRNELTALERSEQIAEWLDLTTDQAAVSAHFAPKLGRPEAGINRASRELGIERTEAQRASGVASLSPEAKETAKDIGLDDNRSALLEASKKASAGDQADTLRAIKDAGSVSAFKAKQKPVPLAPDPMNAVETKERWLALSRPRHESHSRSHKGAKPSFVKAKREGPATLTSNRGP